LICVALAIEHTLVVLRTTHLNKKIMRRKAGWSTIKNRCGLVGDVMETLLIAGACILTIFAGFWLHLRWSVRFIADQFAILDAKIAEALTKTLENLPIGEIEPVNPIQMMIMQMIQDNMAKNPAKVVNRDEQGLFTAESNTESEK
jgi:hypothetical protein